FDLERAPLTGVFDPQLPVLGAPGLVADQTERTRIGDVRDALPRLPVAQHPSRRGAVAGQVDDGDRASTGVYVFDHPAVGHLVGGDLFPILQICAAPHGRLADGVPA